MPGQDLENSSPPSSKPNGRLATALAPETDKSAEVAPATPLPPRRPLKKLIIGGAVGLAIVAAIYGYRQWQFATTHEETDNAYVTADVHPINARIAGTVSQVAVNDNQLVNSGAGLLKLDPSDYAASLEQAKAALETARYQAGVAQANIGVVATTAQGQTTQAQGNIAAAAAGVTTAEGAVAEAQAGVPAAQAQLAQVEAALVKAQLDYDRFNQLAQSGAIPRAQLDAAKATYDATLAQRQAVQAQGQQANAKLVQAQQNLSSSAAKLAATKGTLQTAAAATQQTTVNRQQYKVALAAIVQAEAQVKTAQLQLSYTTITAPTAGRVGNKTVQVGQRVQPGQTLMSVVSNQPWVVANFKETQLTKMQPGQVVEIKIDAFPGRRFTGRLDSLAPASGARFALLPPDNATGNFTKIVQRFPVKITFAPDSLQGLTDRLTPGMSATVTVDIP
jgi:membrane fusion protein, multidrug efflux system